MVDKLSSGGVALLQINEPKPKNIEKAAGDALKVAKRTVERVHHPIVASTLDVVLQEDGIVATSIVIQGKEVVRDLDVAATAGGYGRAVDLVFNDIKPRNGLISIRFFNPHGQSALVQAIEKWTVAAVEFVRCPRHHLNSVAFRTVN